MRRTPIFGVVGLLALLLLAPERAAAQSGKRTAQAQPVKEPAEVVLAFTVEDERSLDEGYLEGFKRFLIKYQRFESCCLGTYPNFIVAVHRPSKTVFVKGPREDVESFQALVLAFDHLLTQAKRGRSLDRRLPPAQSLRG
jgi:hypothetical protein